MEGLSDDEVKLYHAFFPYAAQKTLTITQQNGKFVHYTSARVAMSVLQRKEVWMRQATTMNDFREVEYGISQLIEAYTSDIGEDFKNFMESIFPGICREVAESFDKWQPSFRAETYLTCISEHLESEDITGRLSMWRAYGGQNSVAIVMNNGSFLRPSQAINAFTSPVLYSSGPQFFSNFKMVVDGLKLSRDFIASQDRQTIFDRIFEMFRYAALCTKHHGFHEEREWRIIYSPKLYESNKLIQDIQEVDGVPQRIYKIPLKNYPDEGFTGAEPDELLSRIIIGPTQYPYATADAFLELLARAGVSEPHKKIFLSDIPLRR